MRAWRERSRGVSAKADLDTNRTGVSAQRQTQTGQECGGEGGHGQDSSVGMEADMDRTGVSA